MRTFSFRKPKKEKFIVGNYRERRALEQRLARFRDLSEEWGDYFYFFDEFLARLKDLDVKSESDFDDAIIEFMAGIEDSYIESGELSISQYLGEFLLTIESVLSKLYHYIEAIDGFENIHRLRLQRAGKAAVLIIERDNR